MKQASYSTAVKAIAMSVALAFSTMTFAAETKCSKVALADKKAIVNKVAPTTVTKKAPSFLFVIQAKQGKIETKNGKTYLVLQHADVNHVIMFSDRPNRIGKPSPVTIYKNSGKSATTVLKKTHNAVLSSAGQSADCDTQWHDRDGNNCRVSNFYFGGGGKSIGKFNVDDERGSLLSSTGGFVMRGRGTMRFGRARVQVLMIFLLKTPNVGAQVLAAQGIYRRRSVLHFYDPSNQTP